MQTGGFASLESINTGEKRDHMESFVLAETFKSRRQRLQRSASGQRSDEKRKFSECGEIAVR